VFASTHRSEKGNPSLSIHAPGNWRGADLGGQVGKVCKTSAFILKYLFQKLNKNYIGSGLSGYEITLEATHHGPLINIPCCFIELGSSEPQWRDEKAAEVLAKTIIELQNYEKNNEWVACIGIGGPHYCPGFNKIQLKTKYAVSHIIPEYALPLTETMLKEAEEKTQENINLAIIDWKGCGKSEERQKAINLLNQSGLSYKRTDQASKDEI
jgi:D-aminoacyl-tRNA deacylase